VIKDSKNSKDASYKFHKSYAAGNDAYYLKEYKFQKGDNVNFSYATINGKKTIISIYRAN
jgi:hypothetical protein